MNATMLAGLKASVNSGAEPWATLLSDVAAQRTVWNGSNYYAALNYSANPRALVECGAYDNPSFGCADERNDAAAAYIHALLYATTGMDAHAAKSAQIMDAWSLVLKNHSNVNAPLQSAWVASVWPRAAEIIRHTWSGWPQANVARFEHMLTSAYLPFVIGGCFGFNGNWELSMAEAITSIAVFTENREAFAVALDLWRGRVPGYFYLSKDGLIPLAPDNHTTESKHDIVANWHGQRVFTGHDGLCQETCRDTGHTQMGFAAAVNTAETALHQGIDLYSEELPRITAAMEFHAKLVVDGAAQSGPWLCQNNVKGLGHCKSHDHCVRVCVRVCEWVRVCVCA
jgi:hypothetical protein